MAEQITLLVFCFVLILLAAAGSGGGGSCVNLNKRPKGLPPTMQQ